MPTVSESQRPIYLDCAATTPVDPRVVDAMLPWLRDHFGNPASSSHAWGWEAAKAVDTARHQVAALVGADVREIVWTSGATEANNLALLGVAQMHQDRGRHLITLRTEHQAVLDTMEALRQQGFQITVLDVRQDGLVDADVFAAAIRPDTILASVMLVNNEIGVIQDIDTLGRICRERGVLLHVDAAQATGKVAIDLGVWPVDLMSMTAHKTYGPKGVGALYVRRKPRVHLAAQMHGGGHEHGLRSGTLATHQIVGMGEAYRIAGEVMAQENAFVRDLQQRLIDGLRTVEGLFFNGSLQQRVPHNINLGFDGVGSEELMLALPQLALSSGSACSSASRTPSHVLKALGCNDERAHASLRLSLGRFTTDQQIDVAVQLLRQQVAHLRAGPSLDAA